MKNKRRQLIINPPVQFKFIFLIFISISIPAMIISFWSFSILQNIVATSEPSSEVVRHAIALSVRKLNLLIVIGFSSIATLLIYWTVLFSNRIVGPIYRLERELENIVENGDFGRRLHFRKDDAFQALASKINALLEEIKSKTQQ
ncbi:MAG: hypothetical protein JW938_07365 [Candidatus Omnitrophica bacterium]|nr:hypothetical protein [Candidatus Omnitrophota bacterium]